MRTVRPRRIPPTSGVVLVGLCAACCLIAAGCGRDRFAKDLDRLLQKDNVSTIGVIGAFERPGLTYSVTGSHALVRYLARMGGARYTIIATDSTKVGRLVGLLVEDEDDLADPAVIARLGHALGFRLAAIAVASATESDRFFLRVVEVETGETYLTGEAVLGQDEYPGAEQKNVVDQRTFHLSEDLDFRKFYVGTLQMSDSTEVPITLDLTATLPSGDSLLVISCTLNSPDSRTDLTGQISREDNIIQLPGLGTGIVYVNAEWKIVFESTRARPYWKLAEEGAR